MLAVVDAPFASTVIAVIGIPLAVYAAIASDLKGAITVSIAALALDLAVIGYWIYVFVDALQGAS